MCGGSYENLVGTPLYQERLVKDCNVKHIFKYFFTSTHNFSGSDISANMPGLTEGQKIWGRGESSNVVGVI